MKPEELTRTIALFQTPYSFVTVSDADTCVEGYVRISEPVTVTFTPRPHEAVMAAAVAAIDAQIVEAQQSVRKLEARKAELMALPAPEAV